MSDTGGAGRILIAVAGNSMDDETVRIACKMAKKAGAKVYAINILEINRSLPLGAAVSEQVERAEAILGRAEAILGEFGMDHETELVQARETGPAIVGEADEWNADLIVLGIPYKRRFGDFNLGRTAPYVLKNASCRVVLFREHLNQ